MNMSYCMFENTSSDIRQCIFKLEEYDYDLSKMMEDASSSHEAVAMNEFIKLCREVSENFG